MNLITENYNTYGIQNHVILSSYHLGEECDIVKMPCFGCHAEIIRVFTKTDILDCKFRALPSIYDGVICASCLRWATFTAADIVQDYVTFKSSSKKILTDQLAKLERIQAYLAKVAECQDWDIVSSIQDDANNLRKEVTTWS